WVHFFLTSPRGNVLAAKKREQLSIYREFGMVHAELFSLKSCFCGSTTVAPKLKNVSIKILLPGRQNGLVVVRGVSSPIFCVPHLRPQDAHAYRLLFQLSSLNV